MTLRIFILLSSFLFNTLSFSADKPSIRLGVLAFGTSNWELAALEQQKLLENADFKLEVHKVANPQAGKIALQGGAVDMIVTDWIWVSRMRATGANYSFYPYSSASGALIAAQDSGIKQLSDLCGKRLGIGGDELDKNWLLLQALSAKSSCNLNTQVEKSFGAPPLLNQQLLEKHVDAVLNFWQYAAQLEGEGYPQILSGAEILEGLGVDRNMPNLGYVFNRDWAEKNAAVLKQFIHLTEQARQKMCTDESAWQSIVPLLNTTNAKTQGLLRDRYCAGGIKSWGPEQVKHADKIYSLLRQVSATKLTGAATNIAPETFWFIN